MRAEALQEDGVAEIVASFGIDAERDFLGFGGEAWVWAISAERVLRVVRSTAPDAGREVMRRYELVAELGRHGSPFPLPEAIESGHRAGRAFVIERRLPGEPMSEVMATLTRAERDRLVISHLDAAQAIGDLHLEPRGYWGDLIDDDPLRTDTWAEYLRRVAVHKLALAPRAFAAVDPLSVVGGLPACDTPSYVHLDAFAGNMLADGSTITAVIDFGPMSIVGDRRLDVLAAVVYLRSTQITPQADHRDGEVAMAWLAERGLSRFYEPARRWLTAYWSAAAEDHRLNEWCREVLVD